MKVVGTALSTLTTYIYRCRDTLACSQQHVAGRITLQTRVKVHAVCRSSVSFLIFLTIFLQAAVEYFRLMLPPWDAKDGCKDWKQMEVRMQHAPFNIAGTAKSFPPCYRGTRKWRQILLCKSNGFTKLAQLYAYSNVHKVAGSGKSALGQLQIYLKAGCMPEPLRLASLKAVSAIGCPSSSGQGVYYKIRTVTCWCSLRGSGSQKSLLRLLLWPTAPDQGPPSTPDKVRCAVHAFV